MYIVGSISLQNESSGYHLQRHVKPLITALEETNQNQVGLSRGRKEGVVSRLMQPTAFW